MRGVFEIMGWFVLSFVLFSSIMGLVVLGSRGRGDGHWHHWHETATEVVSNYVEDGVVTNGLGRYTTFECCVCHDKKVLSRRVTGY